MHGVQLSQPALDRLVARGVSLVTCPRSNRTWVGDPPVSRFYESGAAVAIGTDSLASAPDLSIWPELARAPRARSRGASLATARQRDADRRVRAGIRRGARDDRAGQAGGSDCRRAAIRIDDVETLLVEGVESSQVSWVEDGRGEG